MSIRSILLAGAVALASIPSAFAGSLTATSARELSSPVVQLNGNCSGPVIKSDIDPKTFETQTLILTAKHCVKGVEQRTQMIAVPVYANNRIVSEYIYRGKVKAMSIKYDLALIELVDTTVLLPAAKLAPADAKPFEGEDVWTVGYPAGLTRTITTGTFGGRQDMNYPNQSVDLEYFRATPTIFGGNSGGTLSHVAPDGGFEVIGITSAGLTAANFVNFYVPIDQIQTFLNEQKVLFRPAILDKQGVDNPDAEPDLVSDAS